MLLVTTGTNAFPPFFVALMVMTGQISGSVVYILDFSGIALHDSFQVRQLSKNTPSLVPGASCLGPCGGREFSVSIVVVSWLGRRLTDVSFGKSHRGVHDEETRGVFN